MSQGAPVRPDDLAGPVLEVLRRHAFDNLSTLPPFRLPDVARQLALGLARYAEGGDARAAEEVGRQCSRMGLGLRSFLAVERTLTLALSAEGETREEAIERALLVGDYGAAVVLGMREGELEAFYRQRNGLERALHEANERQREALHRQLRELSTPIVPISDRLLLLPLVGEIDAERSSRILERLLAGVAAHRAEVVIIDVTGVPGIDAEVAGRLFATARAVRLLGAQVMLVGIRPHVARVLVDLGVDPGDVLTLSSLQQGIELASRRLRGPRAAPA